jgi:hypothetical protein
MRDNVRDSYYDPSWKHRHEAYDTMTPEQVRAAARAARQHNREHGTDDVICNAFALIAAEDSEEYQSLTQGLRAAAESSRQQRIDALEDTFEPRPPGVAHPDNQADDTTTIPVVEPCNEVVMADPESDDDNADYLDFLGA